MRYPSLSVLVVDISRSRRRDGMLMDYLREKGCQTKAVRDPKRAEEALRKGSVQIVFLLLSARGNPTLANTLRRLTKANSDVPVLVISPKPSLGEAVESIRGRACDYLSSPCAWEELDDCVQTVVGEKGYLQSAEDRLHRTVGDRLRRSRTEKDLTLRQLSNRTGLSVSLISQIELAKSCASIDTLFKLSRALKVKMHEIFAGF